MGQMTENRVCLLPGIRDTGGQVRVLRCIYRRIELEFCVFMAVKAMEHGGGNAWLSEP